MRQCRQNSVEMLNTLFENSQLFFGGFDSLRYFSGAFNAPHARHGGGVRRSYVLERRTVII